MTGHNWETVYSLAFNAAEAGILQWNFPLHRTFVKDTSTLRVDRW
jgi:hypothetical protein